MSSPFPLPAHQTGRADFPHPAFRLVSPRAYGGRSIRALFISPLHLGTAVKLAWKAPGLLRCCVGSRQVTDPRLLQQAHQKSGSFPPPALPGLNSTTTPSVLRQYYDPVRPPSVPPPVSVVEAATLAHDGSPPITRITLPTCRAHYPGGSRRV